MARSSVGSVVFLAVLVFGAALVFDFGGVRTKLFAEGPEESASLPQAKLPEREPPLEYEEGRITQKVSPKGKHSFVQGGLVDLINHLRLHPQAA